MATPPALPGRVSPLDAARDAVDHTRHHLFPFRFNVWLALGFVTFLDQCGRGGGVNFPSPGGVFREKYGTGHEPDFAGMTAWAGNHVGLIVAGAAAFLTLVIALTALVLWLSSRGIFMYIDNVSSGRSDVARPWREHAERAGSLFAWRFGVALAALLGVLLLLLAGGLLFLLLSRGHVAVGPAAFVSLLLVIPLIIVLALAGGLVSLALRDFVAPIQMQREVSCGTAARIFLALLRLRPGAFILFLVLKIAFSVALAFVLLLVGCLTCCCAFLPVVGHTLLQPAFYFERAWSLFLLRQLGHDLVTPPPMAAPPPLATTASDEGLGEGLPSPV
jgi:hypothetical protein